MFIGAHASREPVNRYLVSVFPTIRKTALRCAASSNAAFEQTDVFYQVVPPPELPNGDDRLWARASMSSASGSIFPILNLTSSAWRDISMPWVWWKDCGAQGRNWTVNDFWMPSNPSKSWIWASTIRSLSAQTAIRDWRGATSHCMKTIVPQAWTNRQSIARQRPEGQNLLLHNDSHQHQWAVDRTYLMTQLPTPEKSSTMGVEAGSSPAAIMVPTGQVPTSWKRAVLSPSIP